MQIAKDTICLLATEDRDSLLKFILACAGESEDTGGLHEVVQRMRHLATNRGDAARRSKKDRSFLKSSFREHCKAVEVYIIPLAGNQHAPPKNISKGALVSGQKMCT